MFTRMNRFLESSKSIFATFLLLLAALVPLMSAQASAVVQMTSRKVTINKSAAASTNVQHVFAYTIVTSAAVQGITYEFCTTPLGTCTLPTGMIVQTATHTSQTGFPNNATAFTAHAVANENSCSMATNSYMMCFERTEATTGTGAATHTIATITAPTSKQTVYVRVTLYSNNTFTTATDSGTVAEAFVDQLVTTGRVQERLEFCVASIDGAASLPASVTACAALASTSVDIGVIDNTTIAQSPVTTTATNGSNNKYGIVMPSTNGSGGISISYFPELASSGTNQLRDFRVSGASCNASNANLLDQCFQNATSGGGTIAAGTENFGISIACINTSQGTTTNLGSVTAAYNGDGTITDSGNTCQSEANTHIAWDNSGTVVALTSATSVVDDEIIKIRYAATASTTTPTGAYTVTTNFIATPTF